MSGGSYGYLCYVDGVQELIEKRDSLESMRVSLTALGFADQEATDTQELIDLLDTLDKSVRAKVESLREVWKALEWHHSLDSGIEEVLDAVEKRRSSE